MWIGDAVSKGKDPINNPKMSRTVWEREIEFAEKFNIVQAQGMHGRRKDSKEQIEKMEYSGDQEPSE